MSEIEDSTSTPTSTFPPSEKTKSVGLIIMLVIWTLMLFYGPYRVFRVNNKKCLPNALLVFVISLFLPFIGIFLLPLSIFWPTVFCKKK